MHGRVGAGLQKEFNQFEKQLLGLESRRARLHRKVHAEKLLFQSFVVAEHARQVGLAVRTSRKFTDRTVEGSVIDVQAQETDGLTIRHPIVVNFGRRRENKVSRAGKVDCAAASQVSGAGSVSAQMKFVVPVARIRMGESHATMKNHSFKPRVAPDSKALGFVGAGCGGGSALHATLDVRQGCQ